MTKNRKAHNLKIRQKSKYFFSKLALLYRQNRYIRYYSYIAMLLAFACVLFILNNLAFNQVHGNQVARDDRGIFSDEKILKKYLKKHGVDETIARIKASPVDCHQYVHKVGHLNYELIGEKAFSVNNSECMSGYTHGVTEAFFKEHGAENLSESINLICQNQINNFYAHQCFHGIGHGLMAYNDYDLPEALKGCDGLPKMFDSKESCYSGVFMENVVGALSVNDAKKHKEDSHYHSSEWLSNDPLFPCNSSKINERYKFACYNYQTSRMIAIFGTKYNKVANACTEIENKYQTTCFLSMGRDVGTTFSSDSEKVEKNCSYAKSNELALACIEGASQNSFWHESTQETALDLCNNLISTAYKKRCYATISDRAEDIIESDDKLSQFCDKFEPKYKSYCTAI